MEVALKNRPAHFTRPVCFHLDTSKKSVKDMVIELEAYVTRMIRGDVPSLSYAQPSIIPGDLHNLP